MNTKDDPKKPILKPSDFANLPQNPWRNTQSQVTKFQVPKSGRDFTSMRRGSRLCYNAYMKTNLVKSCLGAR